MKSGKLILIALALTSAACSRQIQTPKPVIQFVKDIVSDKANPDYQLLASYKPGPDDAICIIGSEEAVTTLSDIFVGADYIDNGTGSADPDGLADFSGETIQFIADTVNTPYGRMLEEGREEKLKEITVRHILSAVDTVCHYSPYDLKGIETKKRAKLIVLADPYLAQYGSFDADTLFRSFNSDLKILAPLDVMFDEILEKQEKPSMVGVICDRRYVASGIYSSRFRSKAEEHGITDSDCAVFSITDTDSTDVFRSFLDRYIASGFTKALDALVIDDYHISVEEVKTGVANMLLLTNEESIKYGRYISEDFMILEGGTSIVYSVYDILRSSNMFSLEISRPKLRGFYSYPEQIEKNGSFILTPDSYVQN